MYNYHKRNNFLVHQSFNLTTHLGPPNFTVLPACHTCVPSFRMEYRRSSTAIKAMRNMTERPKETSTYWHLNFSRLFFGFSIGHTNRNAMKRTVTIYIYIYQLQRSCCWNVCSSLVIYIYTNKSTLKHSQRRKVCVPNCMYLDWCVKTSHVWCVSSNCHSVCHTLLSVKCSEASTVW